jgi:hypothetical protein
MAFQGKQLNTRAAINRIKIDSLPFLSFSGKAEVIPYGEDNLYPNRIIAAIKKSPTALGCVKRQSEFIFGNGVTDGAGDKVVNREGETLNDIIWQCIRHGYSTLYGFALHFNFNVYGEIAEIFFVNLEYVRKNRSFKTAEYGIWDNQQAVFTSYQNVMVDVYGKIDPIDRIAEIGVKDYRGQALIYSKDREIYPTSPLDSASISASYEREAQIYPYANIKNGFSGNTVIKYPTIAQGDEAAEEANKVQTDLQALHGSERAGSSLVVSVPMNVNGEPKEFKMVEHLSPTNVDGLFVNQNAKAENDILKVYNMPKILLGISDSGMFNEASFNDAFNYKNSDCEIDRKEIERLFNKFLPNSVFGIDKIELTPLEMRKNNV